MGVPRSIAVLSVLLASACGGETPSSNDCQLGSVTDCSACGDACVGATPFCQPDSASGFACVSQCARPTPTECSGRCVDLETNLQHCGACEARCARDNAEAICQDAACEIAACLPGFDDCNLDVGDGCETSLNTETDCGTCALVCGVGDRCVNLDCVQCEQTSPMASGTAAGGSTDLCSVSASGASLAIGRRNEDNNQCNQTAGTITLVDATASGTLGGSTDLCGATASGGSISFLRRNDGNNGCGQTAGTIALTGVLAFGGFALIRDLCRVDASGTSITFTSRNENNNQCNGTTGTINLAPVCVDTL